MTSAMPPAFHLKPQSEALLEAFQNAKGSGMTTGELLRLTYPKLCRDGVIRECHIGDWRRRKSDLVAGGWQFLKHRVEESTEYRYFLVGRVLSGQLNLGLSGVDAR